MFLTPHPEARTVALESIDATVGKEGDTVNFRFLLEGTERLVLPDPAEPGRDDGLWRTTCFEAFVALDGTAYLEFNFSPSGKWAAYHFDAPRQAMRDQYSEIEVRLDGGDNWIAVEAAIRGVTLVSGAALNLTAVIEEQGTKSYWAIAHPAGPPDFHDPTCFRARLPE